MKCTTQNPRYGVQVGRCEVPILFTSLVNKLQITMEGLLVLCPIHNTHKKKKKSQGKLSRDKRRGVIISESLMGNCNQSCYFISHLRLNYQSSMSYPE